MRPMEKVLGKNSSLSKQRPKKKIALLLLIGTTVSISDSFTSLESAFLIYKTKHPGIRDLKDLLQTLIFSGFFFQIWLMIISNIKETTQRKYI